MTLDKGGAQACCDVMRDLFIIPDATSYFDAAHMGLLPRSALSAGNQALYVRAAPWSPSGAEETAEGLRASFGRLVGSEGANIALGSSTSYIMATATAMFPLSGRAFLHLEDEHPSGVMPWLRSAASCNAEVHRVPRPIDGDWTNAVLAHIQPRIGVACLPHCHWLDGSALDLIAIGAALRAVGAVLVIDATQSVGARPIDVAAVRPALMAVSGYKWLLGPMGVAYAYVAPEHQAALPIESGFAQRDGSGGWFDTGMNVNYSLPWKQAARRFDAGGMYDPIKLALAHAGLTTVSAIGVDRIEKTLLDNSLQLLAGHSRLKFLSGSVPSHIMSFRPALMDSALRALDRHGVRLSRRGPYLRISAHVWNDEEDWNRLSEALNSLDPQSVDEVA